MIKEALKEALLDLKSQLRGRKASAYLAIEEIGSKKDAKPAKEAKDDKADLQPKRQGASAVGEVVEEGMEDLKAQMKSFMGKKRTGKGSGRPGLPLPNNAPKAAEPKAKGKTK